MIYVALLEGVALIATALTFSGVVRSLVRQQARERETLLNKIMYLAGRTWEPPPADDWEPAPEPIVSLLDPTQLPDY